MDLFEEEVRGGYDPKEGFSRIAFGGFGIEKYKRGERVDPKVQAAYNLNKTLEKYPEFTKDARMQIQAEFSKFPNIAVMNLETIAAVLNFLRFYPNPTPNEFKDDIIVEFFSRLLPDKSISSTERQNLIIRLKAEFLKYIQAILAFRSEETEEIEEEQTGYVSEEDKYGKEEYEEEEEEEKEEED